MSLYPAKNTRTAIKIALLKETFKYTYVPIAIALNNQANTIYSLLLLNAKRDENVVEIIVITINKSTAYPLIYPKPANNNPMNKNTMVNLSYFFERNEKNAVVNANTLINAIYNTELLNNTMDKTGKIIEKTMEYIT